MAAYHDVGSEYVGLFWIACFGDACAHWLMALLMEWGYHDIESEVLELNPTDGFGDTRRSEFGLS